MLPGHLTNADLLTQSLLLSVLAKSDNCLVPLEPSLVARNTEVQAMLATSPSNQMQSNEGLLTSLTTSLLGQLGGGNEGGNTADVVDEARATSFISPADYQTSINSQSLLNMTLADLVNIVSLQKMNQRTSVGLDVLPKGEMKPILSPSVHRVQREIRTQGLAREEVHGSPKINEVSSCNTKTPLARELKSAPTFPSKRRHSELSADPSGVSSTELSEEPERKKDRRVSDLCSFYLGRFKLISFEDFKKRVEKCIQKRVSRSKWSEVEEVILLGVTMDCHLNYGAQSSWTLIRNKYNIAVKEFGVIHYSEKTALRERTSCALKKHYRVMYVRVNSGVHDRRFWKCVYGTIWQSPSFNDDDQLVSFNEAVMLREDAYEKQPADTQVATQASTSFRSSSSSPFLSSDPR